MKKAGFLLLLISIWLVAGCSAAPKCDELMFYEYAAGGKRIDLPDDLDPLDRNKEMVIPEASPRPPRDLDAGCLDKPPTLRTSEDEEEPES